MTGQRVGHYQILEQIGAGGMGEVFRARDERLQRDVALKLIRPASSGNPDHIRRFEQEARAAAALNHPNIVAIYDIGFDRGLHYIVSELLEGETLRQRLDAGPLSLRQTTDYGLQVVQGLIAAHERRIVHRDLKPENLFLTREGRIKILDFGVAKLQPRLGEDQPADNIENMATVTKSGAVIGTVAYMSPEQLRGKTVDSRSDIFSVGAILYEMLTGRRAFAGETEVDTMTAVLREEPQEIDLEATNIPPAFQEIARHCLEKEPENRFQSARDLSFALQTLSGGENKAVRFSKGKPRATRIILWVTAGVLAATGLLLLGRQLRQPPRSITYRRLTFEQGTVFSARFASDGQSIIYGAAWNGKGQQLFSTVGNSLLPQPLNLLDADLLAVSPTNELAVAVHGIHGASLESENGMLARAPMAAGSPREVLKDVGWADWDAKGEMAVVHHIEGQSRLEYPIGHVLDQSSGWIGNIRFSPQGDKIAFINHPLLWDDGGWIAVIDLSGRVKTLSPQWESADGLAWTPDGKEIWFTAAEKGLGRSLRAVDLSANMRMVLDLPSALTLQDISSDGRVLMTLDTIRMGMDAVIQGEKDEVDLSWHDWNIAKDISRDGQRVLFEDSSEAAGSQFSVVVRKINGDLPIRLGEGATGGLSPDGQWAISISGDRSQNIVLLPLAAGQPRKVETGILEHFSNTFARFLADGNTIAVNASEPGHAIRGYLLDLNGGPPHPITPEGVRAGPISTDGRYVVGFETDTEFALYPVDGTGAPRRIPHLDPDFEPVRWNEDSSELYGYRRGELPSKVYRVEVGTGKETMIQELRPLTPAGVIRVAPIVVSADGKHIVYSYNQELSVLYLISGLS
ncbi:MAG TPA: protein kinase [Candidatus Sulfotelmatobacter sp.]|jgi:eukaryotic-like serine/threonine-protein kinase